jgi:hypothetical protein
VRQCRLRTVDLAETRTRMLLFVTSLKLIVDIAPMAARIGLRLEPGVEACR